MISTSYWSIVRLAGGMAILFFLFYRFHLYLVITARLGHHSRKKWKKRRKGQTLREWFFYDRYYDIAPHFLILYYLVVISIFVLFTIMSVLLFCFDKENIRLLLIENVFFVFFMIVSPLQFFFMVSGLCLDK